MFDDKRRMND